MWISSLPFLGKTLKGIRGTSVSAPLPCLPLKGLWDGPLFGREPGTLSALQNMDMRPGGYAEARGGMEELQPSGGTATDAISAGGYSCVHQISTSYGWIRTFDFSAGAGSQYSKNRTLNGPGYLPFQSGLVGDAIYFGSDMPFSRLAARIQTAGAWAAATFVYEYWNGSNFNTALTTAETIDWTNTTAEHQFASWTLPTNWATTTVGDAGTGNVLKYWMRIRLSAISAITQAPHVSYITGNWVGMREVYEASQSPQTSATAGTFKRHGQSGTTEEWFSVGTSLFSGASSPTRMASYRGRIYLVNGKEQKRWDGRDYADIGITPATLTGAPAPAAGTEIKAGIYRYYLAWAHGPCMSRDRHGVAAPLLTNPHDIQPLYGVGQAVYLGEVTLSGGNLRATMTIGGTLPVESSGVYIYRTQDLTGTDASVPAGADNGPRSRFPAFLVDSLRRTTESTSPAVLEGGGTFVDANPEPLFPSTEAFLYDNRPPTGMKYVGVHHNRLFLGDENFWYWSKAFQPDVFDRKDADFISLARATGGRHTGGIEFADQFVMFTENQTWALGNLAGDIPQFFIVDPGVGCVAPESIAVDSGVLTWMASDGFYMWDGTGLPERISGSVDQTFNSMSFEAHGGSRAAMTNGRYDIRLATADLASLGNAYRFTLDAYQAKLNPWSTIVLSGFASTLFPLASIHAPLGNNDAGKPHTIWGKADYSVAAGEYGLFLSELTTQDAASNYSCSGTMHFPVPAGGVFTPQRVIAYYQATDGWGTPVFAFTPATNIGSSVGTINTGTPDTGADYNVIGGTFSEVGRGSSDLQVSFTVSSAASGTVNRQRFFGGLLEGNISRIRRGMI